MTIGLIPAGGKATRINGLTKMLLPLGDKTLFEILSARMTACGAQVVLVAPSRDTVGPMFPYFTPTTLAYGTKARTMTEDVLLAEPLCREEPVVFGMADSWWLNENVYQRLALELRSNADVAVAVWEIRADQKGQGGQCQFDYYSQQRRMTSVIDKDPTCNYQWIWGALAWKPSFWKYLTPDMPHVGYGLQPAIDAGLDVRAVTFTGSYYDCGTVEGYYRCVDAWKDTHS